MKKFFLALFLFFFVFPLYSSTFGEEKKVDDKNDDETKLMMDLKTRRSMLDWHQYAAWTTVGLMAASFVTAPEHGINRTHKALGILSGVAYLSAATLAYLAPTTPDTPMAPNISIHKNLAYVHFPAFTMTLVSGFLAYKQREKNEKISGIGKMHSLFAGITMASFALAAFMSTDWSLSLVSQNKKEVAWVFNTRF